MNTAICRRFAVTAASAALLALAVVVVASCLTGRPADDGGGSSGDGAGSCGDPCVPGEGQCVQDFIRFCITDPQGCPRWTAPQPCPPAKPFCSNARCEAVCEDECEQQGQRRCATTGYQICGQHDSDSCLEWGPVLSCGEQELCWPATGQCLPDCGGQPCACKGDETQPCADVGACKGGMRRCIDGFFGPCEWQVGPTPEKCDGIDNDCNNKIDDQLVPELCAKQDGVCKDAIKQCGGAAGWLACDTARYAAHAAAAGLTYEELESLCDGQDNDCNGQIDEPAACCQPDCAGKACGADDGCGRPCKTGSCPTGDQCVDGECKCAPDCAGKPCGADDGCGVACNGPCPPNATCQAGECKCDYLACGSGCCAAGQVCSADGKTCCTPDCSGRSCGPDPVCGAPCGNCGDHEVCLGASGACGSWSSEHAASGPLRAIWGTGSTPLLWATGDAGLVLHHDGSSWQSLAGAPGGDLRGVWAYTHVWVVGAGGVTSRLDGTWQTDNPTSADLHAVWGVAGKVLWAAGAAGTLLRYDLATPGWSPVDELAAVQADLEAVWGSSADDLWVVGSGGTILRYDGNWTTVTSPVSTRLRGVWGSSANDLWVVGDGGVILRNTGAGWTAVSPSPTSANLRGVRGSSAMDVWIVGDAGTLLHHDGQAFKLLQPPTSDALTAVWAAAGDRAWVVSSGGAVFAMGQAP